MKKLLLVLLGVMVLFVSCAKEEAKQEQVVLKIGHNAAADDLRTAAAEKFIEKLEELTDGQFSGRVYPAAQLGDSREMLEGLDIGTVDIVLDGTDTLEIYGDVASIAGLFFLYNDNEHFVDVWTSDIGDQIRAGIEAQTGMYPAGFMNRGPRNITSVKPIRTAEDLQGLKIRVPNSPAMIGGFEALGASPIPMSFAEVFSALERKVIDAQENPYNTCQVASMHQVAPYVVETNHVYASAHFIMSSKRFREYPADVQADIEEAIDYACAFFNEQTVKTNQESLEIMMQEPNVEYIQFSADERKKLSDIASTTYVNYPQLQKYIEQIRK